MLINRILKKQRNKNIAFSIIMPTYNRKSTIDSAINSILNQTYKNFELIIIDDGSTDGTSQHIHNKYKKELKNKKIKYFFLKHVGVCRARNFGLSVAKNDWIGYIDSDNTMLLDALETFANHTKFSKTLYANLQYLSNNTILGKPFNYDDLLKGNYIDLGVFVHHKSLYKKLGGFDKNMTRLVDWDLILTYTKKYKPYYIEKTVLLYNDIDDKPRITNSYSFHDNYIYIQKKHRPNTPIITTMITTYNHEKYIEYAIESALKQQGDFIHEIIISDDGSTDSTPKIVADWTRCHQIEIINISSSVNVGISENMKRCFNTANGEYIAILEGDDYWTDNQKLQKQMDFLKNHKECSFVFSKIKVSNEIEKTTRLLNRQSNLKPILSAEDFCKTESTNLIGNFSCCMFRTKYMKKLPEILYQERLSEIPLAFYLDKFGKIGFMPSIMSVYRQHENGVWSGAQINNKFQQWLKIREICKKVCRKKYIKYFDKIIEEKKKQMSFVS